MIPDFPEQDTVPRIEPDWARIDTPIYDAAAFHAGFAPRFADIRHTPDENDADQLDDWFFGGEL